MAVSYVATILLPLKMEDRPAGMELTGSNESAGSDDEHEWATTLCRVKRAAAELTGSNKSAGSDEEHEWATTLCRAKRAAAEPTGSNKSAGSDEDHEWLTTLCTYPRPAVQEPSVCHPRQCGHGRRAGAAPLAIQGAPCRRCMHLAGCGLLDLESGPGLGCGISNYRVPSFRLAWRPRSPVEAPGCFVLRVRNPHRKVWSLSGAMGGPWSSGAARLSGKSLMPVRRSPRPLRGMREAYREGAT